MKYLFLFIVLTLGACSSDDNEDASEGCKEYCNNVDKNCLGDNAIYDDTDGCFETCALFIDRPESKDAKTGNTLQCRIYHSSVAFANAPIHCQHASITSTPDTCQDIQSVCDTYCAAYFETCTEDFNADFTDIQNCLNECPVKIPKDGEAMADDTTNTVNCRLSQLNKKICAGGKVESEVCVDP